MKTAVMVLVEELLADLAAHEEHEGEPVEMRNRNGSWEDVADRVQDIKEVLK